MTRKDPPMTRTPDIDALADRLAAAQPRLDATDQLIVLTLVRQLALGVPVSDSQLAAAAGLPEAQVTDTLDRHPLAFRDDQGRIIGSSGLTVAEMGDHRIHLHGRVLSTWCAWDTLFLPELLGETVRITSRSPVSDAEIALTVTPSGPTDVQPADTVVSLLLPDGEFDADVIKRFCQFVHFFASHEDGEAWTAEHPGTFLLTVEDAYRLGQLTNHAAFGGALAPAGLR
jgi:alkylmercury lyase